MLVGVYFPDGAVIVFQDKGVERPEGEVVKFSGVLDVDDIRYRPWSHLLEVARGACRDVIFLSGKHAVFYALAVVDSPVGVLEECDDGLALAASRQQVEVFNQVDRCGGNVVVEYDVASGDDTFYVVVLIAYQSDSST